MRATPGLLALDLVAVLVFAAVGRRSHDEGTALTGVLEVAWPFLVGVLAGWGMSRAWRRPTVVWPVGVAVWLGAVVLGMLLRRATGAGTAASFVLVATVVLAVLLLGWRLVAALVLRARR
ncbi:DUF3054 domain-containing protein [Angustibacter sp. McL0619]|uniref:DUF3054 domain-containing protein n=1 Tax=Angustibacter sp. McL0619 TaxID=3415676 RepID=UPI003CEA2870